MRCVHCGEEQNNTQHGAQGFSIVPIKIQGRPKELLGRKYWYLKVNSRKDLILDGKKTDSQLDPGTEKKRH